MKKYFFVYHIFYLFFLFSFLFIWYTRAYPLLVADADDWTYISYIRQAIPKWGIWNPAKVLPETFMGIIGGFSAFVVAPLVNDYILSFTYSYAFVICIFIVLYVFLFDCFLIKKFGTTSLQTIFISFVFFSSHFLIMKSGDINNKYLLKAINLNCFMNYLIPFLVCVSLVFYLLTIIDDNSKNIFSFTNSNYNQIQKTILVSVGYLAIFSNMVDNILLISVIVSLYLFLFRKNFFCIKNFCESHFFIYLLILEVICLIFEANGGRAKSLEFNFYKNFIETFDDFLLIIKSINKTFIKSSLLLLIVALYLIISKKDYIYFKYIVIFTIAMFICFFIQFGLMVRIGLHKISRCENIAVLFIYYIVIFSISLCYIIKTYNKLIIFLPLVSYILFVGIISGNGHSYERSYSVGSDFYHKLESNRDIVNQFVEADRKGLKIFDLYVPGSAAGYSWVGERYSNTLYNHHVISYPIKCNVIVSEQKNIQYNEM